ncbi:MAG: hypothetical protein QOE11_3355 [Solirubrobacteraceae bacterium]|jgi:uncharacterized protein (DUF427 family)|nr:hypothetical protein [Solirubrobacteraceae bacterium]
MPRALFADTVIAESDDTVVVEGNHYFPAGALHREYVQESGQTSVCPWKGTASYYDVVVGDERAAAAAWYYPDPKPKAEEIRDHVAFWNGVRVEN